MWPIKHVKLRTPSQPAHVMVQWLLYISKELKVLFNCVINKDIHMQFKIKY